MNEKYYIWIDVSGDVLTCATKYEDTAELSAAQECPPVGAFGLRIGTKTELMQQYVMSDSDFDIES